MEKIIIDVHGLILDHLPVRSSKTPSGWITMDCPVCSDRRKRGGVIVTGPKISYHCFNCGFKTGWSPGPRLGKKYRELAEHLGADKSEINRIRLEVLKHSDELENTDYDTYVYSENKFEPQSLPEGTVELNTLPTTHEIRQYAIHRGIDGLYPLYYSSDVIRNKRLLIPFIYDGNIVGWTGRHINPPSKNTAKYLHEKLPANFVFNVDKFVNNQREIIVVTEGIIDAILIDGVAVLSNELSAEQAHLISKLGDRIILCPDRDRAGKKLISQATELGWEVSFPPWHKDCKDAADAVKRYGRLATLASIIKHSTSNTTMIKVKTKMENK